MRICDYKSTTIFAHLGSDIRKETEGKAAKMGEHQQFDNSSDASAIKNIFQCKFKQRSSFFHQGNGVSKLKRQFVFVSSFQCMAFKRTINVSG